MRITEDRAFEMIRLGNDMKAQGEFGLANLICAMILFLDRLVEGVTVEIETQDPNGDELSEAFYDLVRISVREESLRIPLPILNKSVGIALVKRAVLIDREQGSSRTPLDKKSYVSPEEFLTLIPELVEDSSLCKKAWEYIVDAESAILTAVEFDRPDDADSIIRVVDYLKTIHAE